MSIKTRSIFNIPRLEVFSNVTRNRRLPVPSPCSRFLTGILHRELRYLKSFGTPSGGRSEVVYTIRVPRMCIDGFEIQWLVYRYRDLLKRIRVKAGSKISTRSRLGDARTANPASRCLLDLCNFLSRNVSTRRSINLFGRPCKNVLALHSPNAPHGDCILNFKDVAMSIELTKNGHFAACGAKEQAATLLKRWVSDSEFRGTLLNLFPLKNGERDLRVSLSVGDQTAVHVGEWTFIDDNLSHSTAEGTKDTKHSVTGVSSRV